MTKVCQRCFLSRHGGEGTNALFHSGLHANVGGVLSLEGLDEVGRQRFVPSRLDMDAFLLPVGRVGLARTASRPTREGTCLCFGFDHAKVELVLVFEGGLFAQFLDAVLLGVEVPRSLDIVLVLLEVTESFPMGGLGSFPVDGVALDGQLHEGRERERRNGD